MSSLSEFSIIILLFWKKLSIGVPYEYSKSILGFAEHRSMLFLKLLGGNYFVKLSSLILARLGFRIRSDFPSLVSSVSYSIFAAHFLDLFKTEFLPTFFPSINDRRQRYVVNRSFSVAIWVIAVLVVCEMFSIYFKVPLSSTLAFGGVGGLALGLSARDIAANFLGGMLLLFNEPFTPGDMVTFKTGGNELLGRVERVGWGQTRIRGRDTRPTYVPNSHFVQIAVTNMERITHRRFLQTVPIRFQDANKMEAVIEKIKENLITIKKLDRLSQPFRVSFVRVASYALEIEITCYFATKSLDEFLILQQEANLQTVKAIHQCGADLALPTTILSFSNVTDAPGSLVLPQVGPSSILNSAPALSSDSTSDSTETGSVVVSQVNKPTTSPTTDSVTAVKTNINTASSKGSQAPQRQQKNDDKIGGKNLNNVQVTKKKTIEKLKAEMSAVQKNKNPKNSNQSTQSIDTHSTNLKGGDLGMWRDSIKTAGIEMNGRSYINKDIAVESKNTIQTSRGKNIEIPVMKPTTPTADAMIPIPDEPVE